METEENFNASSQRSSSPESSSSSDFRRIRGRGRGRRRGRRPGGVRGRGVRGVRGVGARRRINQEAAAERVAAAREQRDIQLRATIATLEEQTLRNLVGRICERDPTFVFDVLNEASQNERRQGYHPQPSDGVPSWCTCNHCREMPSEIEKLCCGQTPTNCFSIVPDFQRVVLDDLVLLVARRYREDIIAAAPDADLNRGNRHAAYRQFILWHHGHLGARNRRVIPSCCVWRIRDKFPDTFSQYRGFIGGRLG
ncbi:P2X purinoceptor 7-like [Crassostrea angulata]|uniref:P2X purinoceptor 7-like n=1 Tax=Magallana angulata TaxID=2784310 RepID=UPI0022B155C9|nr:P2X purinoceptor 7-like [Crassostrea angulata]